MSAAQGPAGSQRSPTPKQPWATVPSRPIGWIAFGAAVVGIGSWFVLPLITTLFGETYPVTDTYVMPLIGAVLLFVAAVLNPLALWVWKQRNVLTLIATILTVGAALFILPIVIGEGIGGA